MWKTCGAHALSGEHSSPSRGTPSLTCPVPHSSQWFGISLPHTAGTCSCAPSQHLLAIQGIFSGMRHKSYPCSFLCIFTGWSVQVFKFQPPVHQKKLSPRISDQQSLHLHHGWVLQSKVHWCPETRRLRVVLALGEAPPASLHQMLSPMFKTVEVTKQHFWDPATWLFPRQLFSWHSWEPSWFVIAPVLTGRAEIGHTSQWWQIHTCAHTAWQHKVVSWANQLNTRRNRAFWD